jgi:hypothetical protein
LRQPGVTIVARKFHDSPSSAAQPLTPTVSVAEADLKRLTYRALMLRGMACSPVESQSFSENRRDVPTSIPCETSHQILRDLICGRINDTAAFEAAVDRSLQQLALSQVVTTLPKARSFCNHLLPCFLLGLILLNPGRVHRTPNYQPR